LPQRFDTVVKEEEKNLFILSLTRGRKGYFLSPQGFYKALSSDAATLPRLNQWVFPKKGNRLILLIA
jgi:hypothetical protein